MEFKKETMAKQKEQSMYTRCIYLHSLPRYFLQEFQSEGVSTYGHWILVSTACISGLGYACFRNPGLWMKRISYLHQIPLRSNKFVNIKSRKGITIVNGLIYRRWDIKSSIQLHVAVQRLSLFPSMICNIFFKPSWVWWWSHWTQNALQSSLVICARHFSHA